ncbi:5445_t:CDS:2 [Dentiscutata erythropus]|uniref:5445_t:CDS:1 n=1 Tax=Dentiscutata erythropus TaxID=1348616 RepID=A0A9N9CJP8_9GLOM|nr:5445_t:CDS:2 [Dentiscutata erythropus]
MGEATKAIGVLKIILFLLYFILWIYFKVNEFDSHTSKSFTINIILAFAFAFSIIFFCTEIVVLAEEEDEAVFITAILNLVFELFVMFWVNVSTDEISFAIFCKLSLILFTFIYFGAAFSNIYFLSEETYSMIDGLIWVILTSSFVETVSILGLK